MNVPKLRFKDFEGKLLNTTFKKVVLSNQYGPRFNANDYDIDGNVKTIRGTDISLDGEIKYSQVPIAKLDSDFIKNHILKDGDLVMITTADCGVTGVFRKQDFDYIPSAYAVKITLNEMGNPEYFKYFFQTNHAKNEVKSFIRKATVANLPCSDILRIKLHLPSIQEQTKIAEFLMAIDEKIAQLTQKCELLAQYKKGVMQKIFSQELRFKDDNGRNFPEWEEKKLGTISSFFSGGTPLTTNEDFYGGKIPFIKSGEIGANSTAQFITELGLKNSSAKLVKSGDLLYALYGATSGAVAVARIDGAINQAILCVRSKLNTYFLYSYLLFKRESILESYLQGGQGNLSAEIIKSLNVPCPIESEQTKIANFLTSIDEKITEARTYLETVKQYKQGLLQQMFI